ncbi:hypothetical protein QTI66_36390 [Variovorax sp. J22R133]|uniref:hypothetical protein n=1 Tax=Variovorax brevis TaxID=3053503 RepID=UPI002578EDD1|nr:hypothetical protein [Variovorax sp. J22R133]MDM0117594.1 hypothetical protein [Variovorax sp. J22R133]
MPDALIVSVSLQSVTRGHFCGVLRRYTGFTPRTFRLDARTVQADVALTPCLKGSNAFDAASACDPMRAATSGPVSVAPN